MANFVADFTTDSGSLDFPKSDQAAVPPGTDPNKYVDSADWNSVNQAVVDLRKNILSGSVFGFGGRYTGAGAGGNPVPTMSNNSFNPFTGDYLYVADTGHLDAPAGALIQHRRDGTEYVLSSVTPSTLIITLAESDDNDIPISIPVLTQGKAVIFLASNGSTVVGERRTQLIVRWGTDNSDTIIAEGPKY